ncbi:MAG: DUF2726 domain-containing protein [Clostridiales bacterium]|nr:DUF2726 domain-containing protein [Clostridiales bacterium]
MNETILALLILFIFIAIAVVVFIFIKKAEKKRANNNKKAKFDGKPRLKLNLPFLTNNEVKFLAVFQNSLPSEYVAFPKVVMHSLVKPDGGLVVYNEIKDDVLDVVVFLKNKMQPVLVVDLIDPARGDNAATKYNEYTQKSIKSLSLPVLNVTLDHDFDKIELLNAFLDKMDPISIAQLKK